MEKKMNNKGKEDRFEEFWNWFSEHFAMSNPLDVAHPLLSELDERVRELGLFEWEMGPGTNKDFAFILSPGRISEMLPLAIHIINFAPELAEWEFYASRPARKSLPVVEFLDKSGKKILFDASLWGFVILKYADGVVDLIVKVSDQELMLQEIESAANIIVEGIIGEQAFIVWINEIELVSSLPDKYEGKLKNYIELRDYFQYR